MVELQEGGMTLDEAKELVKDRDAIRKLVNSRGWKRIIEKKYFEEEALRLVDASCNLAMTGDQKKTVVQMMAGIPVLKKFIQRVILEGNEAENTINAYEEGAKEELLDGDDN